jgi:hypothetical protein
MTEDLWNDFVSLINKQHFSNEAEFEKAFVVILNLMFKVPLKHLVVQGSVNVNRNQRQQLDVLVKNEHANLFAFELKSATETLQDHITQLRTSMRQLRVDYGFLMSPNFILLFDDSRKLNSDGQTIAYFQITDNLDGRYVEHGEKFIELLQNAGENADDVWQWFVDKHNEFELEQKIAKMVVEYLSNQDIIERTSDSYTQSSTDEKDAFINSVREKLRSNPGYYKEQQVAPTAKSAAKNSNRSKTNNSKRTAETSTSSTNPNSRAERNLFKKLVLENYDKIINHPNYDPNGMIKIEKEKRTNANGNTYNYFSLPNGKFLYVNYDSKNITRRLEYLKDTFGIE